MREVKEPIKIKWIWPVLLLISLATIPWVFPRGSFAPLVMGFPLWLVVSFGATIVMALFLSYCIDNFWDMSAYLEEGKDE